MALHAALVWLLIALCVAVYGLVLVELVRIARAILGMIRRIERLADLDVLIALQRTAESVEKLGNAATEFGILGTHAVSAYTRVRALLRAASTLVHRRFT